MANPPAALEDVSARLCLLGFHTISSQWQDEELGSACAYRLREGEEEEEEGCKGEDLGACGATTSTQLSDLQLEVCLKSTVEKCCKGV